MRKSRFTDDQILAILQRAETERNIRGVCLDSGISEQTFYRWKAKYRTVRMQSDRRLRSLEDENRRLKISTPPINPLISRPDQEWAPDSGYRCRLERARVAGTDNGGQRYHRVPRY